MRPLPRIMVAPNGARLTKADHPGVPVTIPEIVDCAVACHKAGADGIHAHVRDADGAHVLDAGLYRELLAELDLVLPGFYTQITTEAVGRYSAAEQRALVHAVRPAAVSVALREITLDAEPAETARFFGFCHEAGIEVQHILYDVADIEHLARLVGQGDVPRAGLRALIVLGRYSAGQKSAPSDLDAPAGALLGLLPDTDWAVCAFGAQETACLIAAAKMGGKARIGFENNRLNTDLSVAATNAERVAELVAALEASGLS
ncbi:3-keto-5-aminohexanoate cleavage protein [Sinirhodobacter sp. HNIBRBA609]|nr:3-keto-5-aminohexanoate cleavage protein [Sinirhodobacter sp. HNIBRBA609]